MAKAVWTTAQFVGQLDSGNHWSSRTITFSFPTIAPPENSGFADIGTFQPLVATQKAGTLLALAAFADVTDVDYIETPGTNGLGGDMRFLSVLHTSPTGYYSGMAGGPGPGSGGDVYYNRDGDNMVNPVRGESGFYVYLHEIGHAMGLNHPGAYNGGSPTYADDALFAQDTQQYTVMSYFSGAETGADFSYGSRPWQYAETLLLYDIAAMHEMYGANPSTRAGSTVYGFNSNAGSSSPYNFARNVDPVLCIYDAGGKDTLDFSGFTAKTRLDLNQGAFSNTALMAKNVSIAFGTIIENGFGGSAADVIRGNAVGNLLRGNGGADDIAGEDGNDTIYGGDNAVSGISLGSGLLRDQSASNGTTAGAIDISRLFSLKADSDIFNSQTVPHVQIQSSSATAGRDYYKVTVNNVGAVITLDVDHGIGSSKPVFVDTLVRLFDSAGVLKAQNDNSNETDTGSQYGNDSLLRYTVTKPGTFIIAVSASGNVNLPAGWSYELQVSVNGERHPNEKLVGGKGADTLYGQNGRDDISGGLGADTITGGADADNFIFNATLGGSNVDTIKDFASNDTIRLDDAIFTKIGTWASSKFWASTNGKAHDTSDRILYETDTGKLSYDADGNKSGGVAAVHFATLSGHPSVGWTDFVIV